MPGAGQNTEDTAGAAQPLAALVFLLGAPRSGTTWLQRLLAAHPDVASSQETGLVGGYLRPLADMWDRQLPADPQRWRALRHRGLPAVLTRAQFDAAVRGFMDAVYAQVRAAKPGAAVVVDKDPGYALQVDLLARFAPDARVLHIVRDGRDVAGSLTSAARTWGGVWAPRRVADAAVTWRHHVQSARQAREVMAYHEVRYEDLVTDGPGTLAGCLAFCGLPADEATAAGLLRSQALDSGAERRDSLVWGGEVLARLGAAPEEPAGFAGEGRSGRWREWSAADRWAFATAAGDLLGQLGYDLDPSWGRLPAGRAAVLHARHRGFRTVRRGVRAARRARRALRTPPGGAPW